MRVYFTAMAMRCTLAVQVAIKARVKPVTQRTSTKMLPFIILSYTRLIYLPFVQDKVYSTPA